MAIRGGSRALITDSFEACLRAAFVVFEHRVGKRSPTIEKVIDDAMSACRRSVAPVSALLVPYRSFAEPLRSAAKGFGDASVTNHSYDNAIWHVQTLVQSFTKRWPDLPSAVAEKVE